MKALTSVLLSYLDILNRTDLPDSQHSTFQTFHPQTPVHCPVIALYSCPVSVTGYQLPDQIFAEAQVIHSSFWASPLLSRLATMQGRNRFVILRTVFSLPVASHPSSQMRSYGLLHTGHVCMKRTFTSLVKCAFGRTEVILQSTNSFLSESPGLHSFLVDPGL